MRPRFLARLALLAVLALPLACAVSDGPGVDSGAGYDAPPAGPAPDPARFGLAPAYRAFFDALEGQGDWVLIEPYGWVFRPRVNFTAWRPYEQGWWEPSESFGWVWISSDDFGWITDHYGSWFYDDYQGWVWQPGPVWGPAWVGWVGVGDYVGWAPLAPAEYADYSVVPPGGLFTFAPAQQFGALQANGSALFVSRPPDVSSSVVEITNLGRVGGVTFNRGPDFATLQRMGGVVTARVEEPALRRVKMPVVQPPHEAEFLLRTRRLFAAGMHSFAKQRASAPPEPAPAPAETKTKPPAPAGSPPDTSRTKPPRRKEPPGAPGGTHRPGTPAGHPSGASPDSTRG